MPVTVSFSVALPDAGPMFARQDPAHDPPREKTSPRRPKPSTPRPAQYSLQRLLDLSA